MATLKALMTTLSRQGLQEQRGEIIYNFTKWAIKMVSLEPFTPVLFLMKKRWKKWLMQKCKN